MSSRILLKNILFTLIFFLLVNCSGNFLDNFYKVPVAQGNIVTPEMIDKLEQGLTEIQVKYIMGSPSISDAFNPNRWDYIGSFTVGSEKFTSNHYTLFFVNGKLTKWQNNLSKD